MNQRNEFTPRDRGLLIGNRWAAGFDGDLYELRPIAEGEIPDELRDLIQAQLVEWDDIENPKAFWGGFSHGVAAHLVDNGITVDPPEDGFDEVFAEAMREILAAPEGLSDDERAVAETIETEIAAGRVKSQAEMPGLVAVIVAKHGPDAPLQSLLARALDRMAVDEEHDAEGA